MESVWALGLLAPLQVVLRLHLPLGSLAPTAGRRHEARGLPDQGQREAGRRLCPLRYNSPSPFCKGAGLGASLPQILSPSLRL